MKLENKELLNEKDWPRTYSCKFLEAGLVSYADSGAGIALVTKETIDSMLPSFIGKPIFIDHQDADQSNYRSKMVGNVIKAWFCPDDGWFYADFIVYDDEAVRCIEEKGYSVSCAYNVLDIVDGGLWHDIPYDTEITEGSFTHLALVMEPRYEDSKITKQVPTMLVNGKGAKLVESSNPTKEEEGKMNFKIWQKKENDKKEDVSDLHVAIDGQNIPLTELVKCYNEKHSSEKKENDKKEMRMAKDDDMVDINGNHVRIGELVNMYKASKKNEKTEDKDDNKKGKEEQHELAEDKKNEKTVDDDGAAEGKKDQEKIAKNDKDEKDVEKKEMENSKKEKNQEFFMEVENASKTYVGDEGGTPEYRTRSERAEAWRSKNSKKKQ